MNIVFKCDVGNKIGLGHYIRSKSLAQHLLLKKKKCILISHGLDLIHKDAKKVFNKCIKLKYKYANSSSIKELLSILKKYDSKILILDSYYTNLKYEYQIYKNNFKYLKFGSEKGYPNYCSILLNPSSIKIDKNQIKNKSVVILNGPKYFIIRQNLLKLQKRKIRKKISKVFINFGGGDDFGMIIFLIKIFSDKIYSNIVFYILTTNNNPNLDNIKDLMKRKYYSNFKLILNNFNFRDLICKCDLGIISGGTILNESVYSQLPSIVITTADNQIPQTKFWNKQGAIKYIGKANEINKDYLKKTFQLNYSYDIRNKMQKNKLIDGKSIKRICETIISVSNNENIKKKN